VVKQLLDYAQIALGGLGVALHFGHPGLERTQRPLELLRVLDELLDRLGVGIGLFLHHRVSRETGRLLGLPALYHARRDADHRRAGRHFLHHHRVGADARAVADLEAAEDLGARADDDAGTQGRVALGARIKRRAAKRHALVNRAAIAHFRRLADNHAHAVVDEDAGADPRARMDLDAGEPATKMRGES